MLVSSFNLSQSFNYAHYLFSKKRFKSEINCFCIWTQVKCGGVGARPCRVTIHLNSFLSKDDFPSVVNRSQVAFLNTQTNLHVTGSEGTYTVSTHAEPRFTN